MIDKPDKAADRDRLEETLEERLEAVEETVETVCRPLAEMLPPERLHAIELNGYEAQLRIDALEAAVKDLQAQVTVAMNRSSAVLIGRIWDVLAKGRQRLTGRRD